MANGTDRDHFKARSDTKPAQLSKEPGWPTAEAAMQHSTGLIAGQQHFGPVVYSSCRLTVARTS